MNVDGTDRQDILGEIGRGIFIPYNDIVEDIAVDRDQRRVVFSATISSSSIIIPDNMFLRAVWSRQDHVRGNQRPTAIITTVLRDSREKWKATCWRFCTSRDEVTRLYCMGKSDVEANT